MRGMDVWALPGGFVQKDEDVNRTAVRVLKQRTGLEDIFLQQFQVFGAVGRNSTDHLNGISDHELLTDDLREWLGQRFVTLGYYALVEYSHVQAPTPDFTSEACEWKSVNELPDLIFDHEEIVQAAYQTLKRHLNYHPIGLNLLPKQFTMPELQALYETVLDKKLDRRNFQRKMLSYDILIRTEKRRTGSAHKAPWLYEFDEEKYHTALEEGLRTIW